MINKIVEVIQMPAVMLGLVVMSFVVLSKICGIHYMDCSAMVKRHFDCFRKRNGKMSVGAIVIYNILPIVVSLIFLKKSLITVDMINVITVIVSILVSMLFTVLAMILDMREKVKSSKDYDGNDAAISSKLLREIYYSLMFEILLSIITLIMCFMVMFDKAYSKLDSGVLYYLIFEMIINLFILLKRIFNIVDNIISQK